MRREEADVGLTPPERDLVAVVRPPEPVSAMSSEALEIFANGLFERAACEIAERRGGGDDVPRRRRPAED